VISLPYLGLRMISRIKFVTNMTGTIDEPCTLTWPEGTEDAESKTVMPGDNVEMVVDVMHPSVLETGQRFNIREGGRTVATGLVTRIVE
jgi:elongation factor Tu